MADDRHNVSITAFAILIDRNKKYHPKVNPFSVVALVVLMAIKYNTVNDDRLMEIKLDLFNELKERDVSEEKREKLMAFLAYYITALFFQTAR